MRLRLTGVVGLLVAAACTNSPALPEAAPTFTPEEAAASPSVLLYLDGTALKSFDLATRESATITDLPSADVAVSPDGARLVAVQETHPGGPGPEGFRQPELVIASTSGPEIPSELGPGRSPTWNASSSAVAAVVPTDVGDTIAIHNLPGGVTQADVPGDERWSLVGWMGDEVVAIGTRSGVVAIPGNVDPQRGLRVAPNRLWGVSPSGPHYLTTGGPTAATIVGPDGRRRVNITDHTLGDGAWSWDGSTVAVTLLGRARQRLVVVDAGSGRVRQVAAGPGVQGNVVWAMDNETFAFVRVDPERRTRLQAMICMSRIDCTSGFSWAESVRLLAFR